MAKWKLFGRSKSEEEKSECGETIESESKIEQKSEKSNLAEYKEKLYTEGSAPKKHSAAQSSNKGPNDQRIWRDLKSIERNVDNIDKNKTQKPSQKLDETVDRILFKRKKK